MLNLLFMAIVYGSAIADSLTPIKADDLDIYAIARAISIDLRGKALTLEEIDQIESQGGIDDALLESWMQTTAFEEQVIAHHRTLFWNNVNFQVNHNTRLLRNYSRYGNQRTMLTIGHKLFAIYPLPNVQITPLMSMP